MKKQIFSALLFFSFLLVLASPSNAISNYFGSFNLQSTGLASPAGMRNIDLLDKDNFWAVGINGEAIKYSSGVFSRPYTGFAVAETLKDVNVLDENNIVVLAVSRAGTGAYTNYWYYSVDGGTNFTKGTVNTTGVISELNAAHFVSTREGYLAGKSGTAYNLFYDSFGTFDTPLGLITVGNTGVDLYGIYFLDSNNGWVCGKTVTNNVIYRTTNGGKNTGNWSSAVYNTAGTGLNAIYFVDALNGWCVGNGGVILKSTDGGANWTVQTIDITENLFGVKFISANVGWATGANYTILRTVNGGTSWISIGGGSSTTLYDVDAVADGPTAWIAGQDTSNLAVFGKYASPNITSVSPNAIKRGETKTITIEGFGFMDSAAIALSSATGIDISNVTITSSREITAAVEVSASASTGSRTVTATNTDTTVATMENAITITAVVPTDETPTVTALSPPSITQGESKSFTITGTNFKTGASVALSGSGVTASSVTFVSSTQITATFTAVAAATVGSRNVIVTNTDGGAGTGSGLLTVSSSTPADNPDITSVVPNSVYQGETVTITLNGTNFPYPLNDKSITLDFGDANITSSQVSGISAFQVGASSINVLSATQILAQVNIGSNAITGKHLASLTIYSKPGISIGATVEPDALTVLAKADNFAEIRGKNPWRPATDGNLTLKVRVLEAGTYRVIIANPDRILYDKQATLIAGRNNVTVESTYRSFSSGTYMVYVLRDNKSLGKWKQVIIN